MKNSLRGVIGLLLGGASLLPSSASALKFEEVTYTSDPSDIIVTVRADEAPTDPSVKNYLGEVRARFADSHVPRGQKVPGDGHVISEIELRQGSHDTSVLTIGIVDGIKLGDSDVRVETRKNSTIFRIARDLLPALGETPAAEPAKAAAPVAGPAAEAAKSEPALITADKPAVAGKAPVAAAKKPAGLHDALASDASPMPMLIALSALLGLAYLGLRLFMRKQAKLDERPTIEVIAQKRLGARHQLIIVRAFGHDHLLSVQGGSTTPIATSEVFGREQDDALSLDSATRLLSQPQPRFELAPQPAPAPVAAPEPVREAQKTRPAEVTRDESAMFGGELFRMAIARRARESEAERVTASDQSGVQARTSQVEERLAPSDETPSATRGAPRNDQALSKAVQGLVRLRREAR